MRTSTDRRPWAPTPGPCPTPDFPGILIAAAPLYREHDDPARWSTRPAATPRAAYACRCGRTRRAQGHTAVTALVTDYTTHRATCPRA